MGRPPLGDAAMTGAEREARRRRTAAGEVAALRAALVEAVDRWISGKPSPPFQRKYADLLVRAYAAQKKGD